MLGMVLEPNGHDEWHEYEGAYVMEPTKGIYRHCTLLIF